jgi:gliding motility-associated-like protein
LADPAFGPVTYEWHMGDPANTILFGLPAPTFTYPAFGTYTATLIVTNGACSYDTSRTITLADEPATFSISKNPVCRGEIFTLTATGIDPANVTSYSWDIDGTVITSTTPSVTHQLNANGTFDVTLTITDINNCTSSATLTNYIMVNGPVADFSTATAGGCINTPVTFNDLSTPAGTVTQWTFGFGDGTRQTFNAPPFTHSYALTGAYNVSLVIRDNAGCTDSIYKPFSVLITRPVAGFRADTVYCPELPLQFVDTSFGTGLTYFWDFGDGGTSTLQNPTHAYPAGNADYTVTLRIRDVAGCEDQVVKTNYIRIRKPKADFTLQDSTGICLPLVTSFTNLATDYSTFLWDFGDGGTSSQMNPSHFYNFYGTYTPKLYAYGPGGCVDSADATVITYDPGAIPITFTPAIACNSASINFTLDPPPNFRFKFYFGDGAIDSSGATTLSHFYQIPGLYFPMIVVTDRFGCQGTKIVGPITIWGAIPLFSMDKDAMCDQGEVFFTNYTVSNDPVISTTWNFGDGNTSTATNPGSHVYNGAGTYIVQLTVTTQNNCTSSFEDTVRVYPTPNLSIVANDTVCINQPQTFEAITAQADSTIVWNWTLGNGATSQSQIATTTYTTAGDFDIRLIATNKLGCADTLDHDLHVVPLPTAIAVTNPLTVISGGSVTLAMNYTGPIVNYLWTPITRLDCTNCLAPVANPQFSTRYQVNITDRHGCRNSGEIMVNVVCTGQNFFVPNTFSPNGDGSNDRFYPRGTGLFSIRTFRIFSRWGEVVFEKREMPVNNPAFGWDGKYKGKNPQADVYVYQLEIVCANGEIIKYSGNIALIL